jgi:hypothetical protein
MSSTPELRPDEIACSVLMPVLNEERHIEASLDAMQAQEFDGVLEFLVIDGGSTDATVAIVAERALEDPRIRLLENPRRTTPSGLNVGLGHARGRWVARMDAHAEYPSDYLKLGVERLRKGGTGWVSGLALAKGRGPVSRAVAVALRGTLGRGGSRKWVAHRGDEEYELDSGVFAGVWERETLLETRGWDEAWVRNQDAEMAGRFLGRGEKLILLPAMGAGYAPRDTLFGLARQYYGYGYYRVMTARRHPHTMRRSQLLSPAVVTTLAMTVAAPRRLRRLARVGIAVYGATLTAAGVQARREAEHPADAALVPAVLAAMHLGYGFGALRQAAQGGPPWAALAGALGATGLAERLAPPPEPVFAPSLERAMAERANGPAEPVISDRGT